MAELSSHGIATFRWVGSEAALLDTPTVTRCGRVVVGRYGGHTGAGAAKNEDGALVWSAERGDWEFAALLDAHYTAQSAALVIEALEEDRADLVAALNQPLATAFSTLHQRLLALFYAPAFRARCHEVEGEASCLIFARKDRFVWWLSIGDCVGYVFHEDLARLGQFALNQRVFYTWVGERNTFDRPVACYTVGTEALRPGRSTLVMLTDGFLECGTRIYANPAQLYSVFTRAQAEEQDVEAALHMALDRVHLERGRDSATALAWHAAAPAR